MDVDHGVEGVQPLLRLARIGVGQLVHVAVEDHVPQSRSCQGRPDHLLAGSLRAVGPASTTITVYTDGACSGNPGPGGWAWAIAPEGVPRAAGGETTTTNQRMEITAVLEALRAHDSNQDRPVDVVSDSTYVVNCFRDRGPATWRANGWRNAKRQPVANADLWKPLIDPRRSRGDVRFRWVKGHSGDPMNDLVDELAVAAIPR